ncbi:MAG: hypothetical protein WC215_01090 [Bacilli bacterium]|jgi:M6 family metalloprotease-like protein|nr:hypothetical protein [Bacilli bacterium]
MKINKLMAMSLLSVIVLASCGPEVIVENFYRFSEKPAVATLRQARKGTYKSDMPTIGDSRVLVLPIEFSDYPASGLLRGTDGAHEDIEKAYFGESEDTQWESLKSYYYKSSYGKVNISGRVLPWFRPTDPNNPEKWFSTEEIIDNYGTSQGDTGISRLIMGWAYTYYWMGAYSQINNDEGIPYASASEFMKDFDGDGDGFIDVIQMVYTAPIQHLNSDLFWAFRSADSSANANVRTPSICGFVWLGYDFLHDNGYYDNLGVYHNWTDEEIINGTAKIDAHTIIHESGHALGADDYYTYDSGNDWGALGGTDMMDYNIGDHNAYTKSIFGWSDPIVVTGEGEVTLESFTDTGDAILLPAYKEDGQVNNSLMDEYIMIEYYRPTGLNEMDATYNYTGNYPKMPDIPGIRVYHVDSRLGLFTYSNTNVWQFVRYVSFVSGTDDNSYIGIANSNTKSSSAVSANKLIHALEVSGQNTLKNTSFAARYSSSMMWQEGDTFGVDTFIDFKLNNGEYLGYKFEVKSMNDTEVKIEFSLA